MIRFGWIILLLALVLAAPAVAQDVSSLRREVDARRAKLADSDVTGRHALAKWCAQNKLKQSEKSLYLEIISIAPNDEPARRALGHVRDGLTWHESEDARQIARGKIRGLTVWLDKRDPEMPELHGHWLTTDQSRSLAAGEALAAHSGPGWHEVLTREWRIRSALKPAATLELGLVLEQAVRAWREDSGHTYKPAEAPTLHMEILKDHDAYVAMIRSDIERFPQGLVNSHGHFDGTTCWGGFFKDWYRTRRILLHEARHQYDMLVTNTFRHMPAWYLEGTAEYWSVHQWDGKALSMGVLNPQVNEHLHFLQRIVRRKQLRGVKATFAEGEEGAIEAEFYQQSWAFVYYLRTGRHQEAFKKWEADLLAGKLGGDGAALSRFESLIAPDFAVFDAGYNEFIANAAAKYGASGS